MDKQKIENIKTIYFLWNMGSFTPCSFILMIFIFFFGAVGVISLVAAIVCSIIYALKFKDVIPISCNPTNFGLAISLTIIIILFFVLLLAAFIITKKYEKLKLTIIFLGISLLPFIALFIILILIPYFSSDKKIKQTLPSIIQKFLESDSNCLGDFTKIHTCNTLSNCTISAEEIIKKKYRPIMKSSIILVSITDGSILLMILFLIFFFAPCPCGPVHDMNRF